MGGGDDDEHGEVNTGVIPSALDDDDLALKENDGGFKDKPANNRMHVENGVHT
jgi:hypothetical protein